MSTTEALRIQLDALQAELYALQAENRKLREAWPEQATLVDVENELAQTREEKVKLVRQVSQLAQADRDGDAEMETREAEQDGLQRTIDLGGRGHGRQDRTGDRLGSWRQRRKNFNER